MNRVDRSCRFAHPYKEKTRSYDCTDNTLFALQMNTAHLVGFLVGTKQVDDNTPQGEP